jgi:hypothetical protein
MRRSTVLSLLLQLVFPENTLQNSDMIGRYIWKENREVRTPLKALVNLGNPSLVFLCVCAAKHTNSDLKIWSD